jgi:hypothetical protein
LEFGTQAQVVRSIEFRDQGIDFRVWNLEFGTQGFRVCEGRTWVVDFSIANLVFRVSGSGIRVYNFKNISL